MLIVKVDNVVKLIVKNIVLNVLINLSSFMKLIMKIMVYVLNNNLFKQKHKILLIHINFKLVLMLNELHI